MEITLWVKMCVWEWVVVVIFSWWASLQDSWTRRSFYWCSPNAREETYKHSAWDLDGGDKRRLGPITSFYRLSINHFVVNPALHLLGTSEPWTSIKFCQRRKLTSFTWGRNEWVGYQMPWSRCSGSSELLAFPGFYGENCLFFMPLLWFPLSCQTSNYSSNNFQSSKNLLQSLIYWCSLSHSLCEF